MNMWNIEGGGGGGGEGLEEGSGESGGCGGGGRGRGGGSSRKGKKSDKFGKTKQPQRGLGVAQLERIRLQDELSSTTTNFHRSISHLDHAFLPSHAAFNQPDIRIRSVVPPSPFPYAPLPQCSNPYAAFQYPTTMMLTEQHGRPNIRYGAPQSSTLPAALRRDPSDGILTPQHFTHPDMRRERPDDNLNLKDEVRNKKCRTNSMGSSSQNSESSGSEEIDLELRLGR